MKYQIEVVGRMIPEKMLKLQKLVAMGFCNSIQSAKEFLGGSSVLYTAYEAEAQKVVDLLGFENLVIEHWGDKGEHRLIHRGHVSIFENLGSCVALTYKGKLSDLDKKLTEEEAYLEKMGWSYLGSGEWRDPITDIQYSSSAAYGIQEQREVAEAREWYDQLSEKEKHYFQVLMPKPACASA